MERRRFMKTSAVIAGLGLLKPDILTAGYSEKPVKMGFIGCGDRGTGVISTMSANNNIHITALADLFRDRTDAVLPGINQLNKNRGYSAVERKNVYIGADAYQKLLLESDTDAVLISTPAYAHPFIFEAAVAAGKHVYCEKPAAPDVYGTLRMLKAAENVKNLSLVLGFQIRYASPYVEMVRRIHRGDIGDIVSVQLYYNSSEVPRKTQLDSADDEFRIRNHFHFLSLSGGILSDQGIHILDVCNWALQATPVYAVGMGGKKGNMGFGDTLTNYQVLYKYPNDINVSIQTSQIGPVFGDVCARFIGTKGYAEIRYNGGFIKGENEWYPGKDSALSGSDAQGTSKQSPFGVEMDSTLFDSDVNKGKSFIQSIQNGKYLNQIETACESTLTAILGREAVLQDKTVSWKELVSSNQRLDHQLNLSKFR